MGQQVRVLGFWAGKNAKVRQSGVKADLHRKILIPLIECGLSQKARESLKYREVSFYRLGDFTG